MIEPNTSVTRELLTAVVAVVVLFGCLLLLPGLGVGVVATVLAGYGVAGTVVLGVFVLLMLYVCYLAVGGVLADDDYGTEKRNCPGCGSLTAPENTVCPYCDEPLEAD